MNEPAAPPAWQPPPRPRRGRWIVLTLFLAGIGTLFLPPVKRKILTLVDRLRTERVVIKEVPVDRVVDRVVDRRVEVPVPATAPAPLPTSPVLGTRMDVSTLFGGV